MSRLTIFLEQFSQPRVQILMAAGVLTRLHRERPSAQNERLEMIREC